MDRIKEIEYSEVHNWMRYLLDYRIKIFNFTVILNATLLTIVLEHLSIANFYGRLYLGILSIVVTIVLLLSERRTIKALIEYRIFGESMEKEINVKVLTEVRNKIGSSKIKMRILFPLLYLIFIILWLIILIAGKSVLQTS